MNTRNVLGDLFSRINDETDATYVVLMIVIEKFGKCFEKLTKG